MLFLAGRPARGFGLTANPSTFAQASIDLNNQVIAPTTAAAQYYANDVATFNIDYSDAVTAWQAAGEAGASSVAEEIDSSGAFSTTNPVTSQASSLNDQLQSLRKSGIPDPQGGITAPYFNQGDANTAASLAYKMVALYAQAITLGAAATGQPQPGPAPVPPNPAPSPSPSPSPPSAASSSGIGTALVATLAIAGAASVILYAAKGSPRHATA